ncbi:uncharacterized protein LOC127783094 [Oryza glaberrima]|uniref:uncharacterized protein LOC127783094 n=1 Tax=Oryza glaberrima TaxID=4538 RepID=UPI00224C2E00|nr:uncharacterized protein LOC127783094 [Oryza glaberrima]
MPPARELLERSSSCRLVNSPSSGGMPPGGKIHPSPLGGGTHLPAIGCGCFDCYTSFWSHWDCSPSRKLIHDAIEAFEDHLATAESSTPPSSSSSKRHDKGKCRPPLPSPMSPKVSPV